MATDPLSDPGLALELGRTLTETVAPEELTFYDELITSSSRGKPPKRDHPIGFGVGEGIAGAVSVVLYAVAQALLKTLWDAAKEPLAGLTRDAAESLRIQLAERFARWAKSRFSEPAPITITDELRSELLAKASEIASAKNMQPADIEKLKVALEAALK
jgi:hypothetical protein